MDLFANLKPIKAGVFPEEASMRTLIEKFKIADVSFYFPDKSIAGVKMNPEFEPKIDGKYLVLTEEFEIYLGSRIKELDEILFTNEGDLDRVSDTTFEGTFLGVKFSIVVGRK